MLNTITRISLQLFSDSIDLLNFFMVIVGLVMIRQNHSSSYSSSEVHFICS